ncbi:glycoside hydrolase family 2 protein [Aplosporella prunicola CBS 121167]|uniref:Glycoside hydrolase family 2 protein n=1 Tax=Aplosporella prunicola CBS 121167 TaxID=1176127 RepID=A0A6A6BL10_9PEZI|nr:glycoside hydrolase family 2 protein [Aplosporella prunicola CBS 121167]KAF2143944.1 glycoside hydrolase family 2 protein [Aplosporella prunicola CBS 121167]
MTTYPRPDFERTSLRWKSLNGPWDFLFDDDDSGLYERWQLKGLPSQVLVKGFQSSEATQGADSESITHKIAAGTQTLLKDNLALRSKGAATNEKRQIQVPFVFQSPASGINERGDHEVLWYERSIEDIRTVDEKSRGDRVLLRFGAVDYEAKVWLNGQYVGGHRGGHVPFEIDISDALESASPGPQRLTLRVYDSAYDLTQPRGKQYWGAKPESIFYTPSGGIWQSVWLETVPTARIADSSRGTVLRSNDIESGDLHARIAVLGRRAGHKCGVELEASIGGVVVGKSERKTLPKETDHVNLDLNLRLSKEQSASLPGSFTQEAPLENDRCWLNGLALWSLEHPLLYDITLRLFDSSDNVVDEVKTQTGMRSLDWTTGEGALKINGRPVFQALCLDQGYWPDTFLTPPSADSLKADIVLAKKMGLNGCRKHQKVEDPIFLYWADRLGFLVWGEFANAYEFGLDYMDRINQEWMEAVNRDINHPSIVTWTPVNESWAYTSLKDNVQQRNHIRALYYLTKSVDPTRPINDNCGWEHVCTDITSFHDYSDSPALTKTCSTMEGILGPKAGRGMFVAPIPGVDPGSEYRPGSVVMNTEFGGVNIAMDAGNKDSEWGYTTASDPEDLLKRLQLLMNGIVQEGHCSGFVYTQLADIEQETNGLYTFDRKEKLESAKVKAVMDDAQKIFYKSRGI